MKQFPIIPLGWEAPPDLSAYPGESLVLRFNRWLDMLIDDRKKMVLPFVKIFGKRLTESSSALDRISDRPIRLFFLDGSNPPFNLFTHHDLVAGLIAMDGRYRVRSSYGSLLKSWAHEWPWTKTGLQFVVNTDEQGRPLGTISKYIFLRSDEPDVQIIIKIPNDIPQTIVAMETDQKLNDIMGANADLDPNDAFDDIIYDIGPTTEELAALKKRVKPPRPDQFRIE
jgi:hypothetical protein